MNEPIIVGVDGSDTSKRALSWAIEEARLRGVRLRVVIFEPSRADLQVWGAGPGVHGMDVLDLEVIRDKAVGILDDVRMSGSSTDGLDVLVEAYAGAATEQLPRLSERAALLVVGARGNGWLSHLGHGSVVGAVSKHAHCPVVIVPAADRASER